MSKNKPLWLFNEGKQVGIDYYNQNVVNDYDRQHEQFRNFKEEAQRIAKALSLTDKSMVLDLGCGTGGLTIHLAPICQCIHALDISKTMLDTLRSKVADLKIENVRIEENGFLTFEPREETYDAIIANISLHHLPDFWKQIALCRLNDILKPCGKLFLADIVFGFDPLEYESEIDKWLEDMDSIVGETVAEEMIVHIREEFSTWKWIMDGLLKRAGFIVENDFEIHPNLRTYVCTKNKSGKGNFKKPHNMISL